MRKRVTVEWEEKDVAVDEEYNSDDDDGSDNDHDGTDDHDSNDNDADGNGDSECDGLCIVPYDEELDLIGDEEHSHECDFSVAVIDDVVAEENGNGQEQQCVPVLGSSYYKIVGDNIDKNIRPSFQRVNHQTKSLHYFHSFAAMDRIDFSNLSNVVPHNIKINFDTLLPGKTDLTALLNELKILVSR